MSAPGSASGWTNSSNVIANDGAYASATAVRSGGFGSSSTALHTDGYGFTGGAGDTVQGVTVSFRGCYNGLPAILHVYLMNGIYPAGSEKTVTLTSSMTTYLMGGSGDLWGSTNLNGSNIGSLGVNFYVEVPGGSPDGTAEGRIDWVQVTVDLVDTTPNAFSFTDQTGVARSTSITSNAVTISGLAVTAPIGIGSATGEYSINGGAWTSASGWVNNGDSVRVRNTSSSSFNTSVDTTLTIGATGSTGVSDTFTSTTEVQDTTPDAFGFTTQNNINPSIQCQSNEVTITGINDAASVSFSGGATGDGWYKNGTFIGSGTGTVVNGDRVMCAATSVATFGGARTVTLTIGGVAGTFTVNTRAADTTPDAFSFTDQTNVALSTLITSNYVTISGIEAAAAISISGGGGEYQINSGAWTTGSGTINNGDQVRVRHTSAASNGQSVNSTLTVGGVSDTFTTTTPSADSVPDAFGFTSATNQRPGRLIESNAVTITGINVAVGVTCSAGAQVSVNGGGYSTTGTISNGQTVKVRVQSSVVPGKAITASVTIGGVTGNFSVTTVRSQQADI